MGGGQKSLNSSNINNFDQINWPVILRTQISVYVKL